MKREELEEGRRLLSHSTPGAWKAWGMQVRADQAGDSNVNHSVLVATTYQRVDGKVRTFDADLICWFQRNAEALLSLAEESRWRSVAEEPPTERDSPVIAYRPEVQGDQVGEWAWHAVVDEFASTGSPTHWRPSPKVPNR